MPCQKGGVRWTVKVWSEGASGAEQSRIILLIRAGDALTDNNSVRAPFPSHSRTRASADWSKIVVEGGRGMAAAAMHAIDGPGLAWLCPAFRRLHPIESVNVNVNVISAVWHVQRTGSSVCLHGRGCGRVSMAPARPSAFLDDAMRCE